MSPHENDALARIVLEAEARLTNEQPRFIKWDDEHDLISGVLIRSGRVPDKFREGSVLTNLVLRQPSGALVSALAYPYVERQLAQAHNGRGVQPGDVIAIKRGPLVERGGDLPKYREWSVEIVEGDVGIADAAARARAQDEPPASFDPVADLDPGPESGRPMHGRFTRGGDA